MDCGEKVVSVIYTDDGLYLGNGTTTTVNIYYEILRNDTTHHWWLVHDSNVKRVLEKIFAVTNYINDISIYITFHDTKYFQLVD